MTLWEMHLADVERHTEIGITNEMLRIALPGGFHALFVAEAPDKSKRPLAQGDVHHEILAHFLQIFLELR